MKLSGWSWFSQQKFTLLLCTVFICIQCNPSSSFPPIKLGPKAKLSIIEGFSSPTVNSCESYPDKVSVPYALHSLDRYKTKEFFEYCFEVSVPPQMVTERLSLNLGFIDLYYRVYWNGRLVDSTQKDEDLGETLLYDKRVVVPLELASVKEKNTLQVQVRAYGNIVDFSAGMYAGVPKLDLNSRIRQQLMVARMYQFGKIVLFYSSAILFFLLYFGKKDNRKYLHFALFLFSCSTYFAMRLELRYDLGLHLTIMKRIEYLAITLIFPSFSWFLYSILQRKSRHILPILISSLGIGFFVWFLVIFEIPKISHIHYAYHVPFMIFSCFMLIGVPLQEIYRKNKRAKPIFYIVSVPSLIAIVDLLNTRFQFFPAITNLKLSGDAITIFVVSMTIYLANQYYVLQKKLESIIRKEESIRRAFQHYVPPKDIEKILNSFTAEGEVLNSGTLEKKIIFFCDIRNFTTLTESMSAGEVVTFLNNYFKEINKIIVEEGGVIDKLIGDCIMAWFDKDKEAKAVMATFKMKEALEKFNKKRIRYKKPPIWNGVGLSSGKVVVGNIGSENKMDYTVIGDSVNVASRLESLTKFYQVNTLVTEDIYLKTKDAILYREIDTIQVIGKKDSIRIFEPVSIE